MLTIPLSYSLTVRAQWMVPSTHEYTEKFNKFTIQIEMGNKILFRELDDGIIKTKVYRKLTHTGQYLDLISNYSHNVKVAVSKCLYDSVRTICTNEG